VALKKITRTSAHKNVNGIQPPSVAIVPTVVDRDAQTSTPRVPWSSLGRAPYEDMACACA